jgi:hypothetical protein
MQGDIVRFRRKLIVLLLYSNLNKIDINRPLSAADDRINTNIDPDECKIIGYRDNE